MKKIITIIIILGLAISNASALCLEINKQGQVISAGGKTPMENGQIVNYDGKHPHYRKVNKGKPDKKNITNYKYKDGGLIYNPSGNKKKIKKEREQAIQNKMREEAIQELKNNGNWKDEWNIDDSTGSTIKQRFKKNK